MKAAHFGRHRAAGKCITMSTFAHSSYVPSYGYSRIKFDFSAWQKVIQTEHAVGVCQTGGGSLNLIPKLTQSWIQIPEPGTLPIRSHRFQELAPHSYESWMERTSVPDTPSFLCTAIFCSSVRALVFSATAILRPHKPRGGIIKLLSPITRTSQNQYNGTEIDINTPSWMLDGSPALSLRCSSSGSALFVLPCLHNTAIS